MEEIILELLDHEYEELNAKYPPEKGSALIGERAEAIVKMYFRRRDDKCQFVNPEKGADLKIIFTDGSTPLTLEVKGTKEIDISFHNIRVSSDDSMRLLSDKRMPLYRVTDIFGAKPNIYILIYGTDFDLTPEPRWRVKRIK